MPKLTFIGEHTDLYGKPDGTKVTYECNVETLNNILEHMELFIRGCGYLPTGTLDFVPDEEFQTSTDSKYNPDEKHSGIYYDTERNK
jgi:hypothetical protein